MKITPPKVCRNCGDEMYAMGLCRLCYVYLRKHGRHRPRRLAEAQLGREVVRERRGVVV